jgi:hypothetical protein
MTSASLSALAAVMGSSWARANLCSTFSSCDETSAMEGYDRGVDREMFSGCENERQYAAD